MENVRRMEELGVNGLASGLKSLCTKTAFAKAKKSGSKGSDAEGSDSSEYLPEAGEGVKGGGDTDTDLEEEPVPLAIEPPILTTRRKVCAKRTKGSADMGPGGRQSKRVNSTPPTEVPLGVSTRSKRQRTSAQGEHTLPPAAENNGGEAVRFDELTGDIGVDSHPSPLRDWTYPDDLSHGEEQTGQQNDPTDEVPMQTRARKPRSATRGVLLDKMTRSMGRRMAISVVEGNRRPHEPVQAAKFASEASVVVRSQVPILTHWKQYKKETEHFEGFVGRLSARLAIDTTDKPTKEACVSVFQSGVRQMRYRLKQAYFNGVPADEIQTTSPVPYMTDAQWCELVEKWSSGKNKAISEQNKRNRVKVRYHQATGSHSYVAQLHSYKEKNKKQDAELGEEVDEEHDELHEELDAVEAFKDFHTSRKKGLSDTAREAISAMETMRAEPVADGQAPFPSADVVSKVLSQSSCNTQFLKNVGIPTSSTKTETSTEKALREQLAAEQESSATLHQQVDELKKKTEKTKREFEEFKKQQEENNMLLKRILLLNGGAGNSQS